ncbi:MAG: ORF6N domain-containing protein [Candidatus Saganbacteria bacterium]|nr:ORF6N domain-containing protein [Candidatus Saganbacteria bacterium]
MTKDKGVKMSDEIVPVEVIENKIHLIRGQKVMLDKDLAVLYGVKTFVLNQAIKRSITRFPEDFMFRLTVAEFDNLTSQIVISSWGGRRHLPYAFTEQGIAMLSSVLHSERAVQVNIAIMRAFVRLRQVIAIHKDLAKKFDLLEKRVFKHDSDIRELVRDIRKLTITKSLNRGKVGFLK